MNDLTARVILFMLPLFIILTGCQKEENTSALAKHEKSYPEIRKKYVYQSLIRLANVNHDPNFEKLIKDVRKIILYLPPQADSTYQIKDLRGNMRTDGYEELVDVRTEDAYRIGLWLKDEANKPHYIVLMDAAEEDIILEIDGEVNVEYLTSINMADKGSLMDLLKGGF